MILILFYDGSTAEIAGVEDVVHKPGSLVCIDFLGAPIASFLDDYVLAYSLNPSSIERLHTPDDRPRRRGRRVKQPGPADN